MALLYRMGTGNGSGSDLKPYIVQFTCDSGYIGQTLTMTYKGTPHAGETVDNVSGTVASDGALTLYPMHSGNWECSCYSSVTGTTMKKTIELSYWGTTNVSFEDTPNGATVTPTDDVQTWLHCANVWNKSYTTISEVVADTTTLNTLISNNNAVDYMVRSTTFATDICSNESAMTYIGLNDYCANKLLADSTWFEAICNTEETLLKKVLNVYVPTLSSNTGSDGGTVIWSTNNQHSQPYFAFDGNTNTSFNDFTNGDWYIGYKFINPVRVNKIKLVTRGGYNNQNQNKLEGYNGTEWIPLTDVLSLQVANTEYLFDIPNENYYEQYRIHTSNSQGYNGFSIIQFYGREEA